MIKVYMIIDTNTGEALVDNMSFDDLAEQLPVYERFYGKANICPCCVYARKITRHHQTTEQQFKKDWYNFIDELFAIGNMEY